MVTDIPDCILSSWNTPHDSAAIGNSLAIGNRKKKLVQEIVEKARNGAKRAKYSKWCSSERSSVVVVDVMPSYDNGMTPVGRAGRQAKMLAAHRIKNHVQCLNNTRGSPLLQPPAAQAGGAGGRAKVHRKRQIRKTFFTNKMEVQTPESRNKAVVKKLEAQVTRKQGTAYSAKVQSSVSKTVSWTPPTFGYQHKPVTTCSNGASPRPSLTTRSKHNGFACIRNFTIDITKLGITPRNKTSHSSSSSSSEGDEDCSDESWSPSSVLTLCC